MTTNLADIPSDFCLRYDWEEGSIPPPDHFAFTLWIGPGTSGRISVRPDYSSEHTPEWIETFFIEPMRLTSLYHLVIRQELFSRNWVEPRQWTEGGSLEWARITAEDQTVSIPSFASDPGLDELYAEIRKMRPEKTWRRLMKKRRSYQKKYNRKHAP